MTRRRMGRKQHRLVIENCLLDCEIEIADKRQELLTGELDLQSLMLRRADLSRQLERLGPGRRGTPCTLTPFFP